MWKYFQSSRSWMQCMVKWSMQKSFEVEGTRCTNRTLKPPPWIRTRELAGRTWSWTTQSMSLALVGFNILLYWSQNLRSWNMNSKLPPEKQHPYLYLYIYISKWNLDCIVTMQSKYTRNRSKLSYKLWQVKMLRQKSLENAITIINGFLFWHNAIDEYSVSKRTASKVNYAFLTR